MEYKVTVQEISNAFHLKLLNSGVDIQTRTISHAEINRPALQMTGFFEYFDSYRMQIIGLVEYAYLEKLDSAVRDEILGRVFGYNIPCIVICRGLEPFPELLRHATQNNTPVLQTKSTTTDFMGEVIRWLKVQLAPRVTVHGVMIDIFGEGVLIMGESGIGKSECALELVKRGHRLVADDAVEVKKVSARTLVGACPEQIRSMIEVRGIGVIDVKQMFGVQSIKMTQYIDMVIKLESWSQSKTYDRLGLDEEYIDILGNKVVCHTIPIRPGRNIAVICETAAINHRQKKMGYNAAQALADKFNEHTLQKD